jgi:RNA polymerase sigma-70 factor (ECF subfamily)
VVIVNAEAALEVEARFNACYLLHGPAVLAYARRRTSHADALDVLTETFTIAWKRCAAGDEPTIGWLIRTASNVLSNLHRGQVRQQGLAIRLAEMQRHAQPGDPADLVSSADHLRSALLSLSKQDRESLLLVAWDELDNQQLAIALDCKPATAAVRLHRARRRFASALERTSL